MEKSVDVGMLIRQSNIMYKNDVIANRKDAYGPGDSIELYFPKGDYILNLAKTKFNFRPVIKTDVQNACCQLNDDKSWAHIEYIKFDQRDAVPTQGDRSRPIFNAFKERLVDADKMKSDAVRQFDSDKEYHFLQAGTKGEEAKNVNDTGVNTHMLTGKKQVPIAADSVSLSLEDQDADFRYQTYRNVYRRRLREALKFGNFSAVDVNAGAPGAVYTSVQAYSHDSESVTLQDNETKTFKQFCLGDLSVELSTMNQIYMGQFSDGIRIAIKLIEPRYALSLVIPPIPRFARSNDDNYVVSVGDTNFKFTSNMSYRITDLFVAMRKHDLNTDGVKIMKQLAFEMPVPYVTYQYEQRSIDSSTNLVSQTTLNARNYLGTVILFTGQGPKVGKYLTEAVKPAVYTHVDYRDNTIHELPVNQYNSDHFFLEYNHAWVEAGNEIYKANYPPIANRGVQCYMSAIDGIDIMFNGKQYGVDFQEFIDRGMAIIIPTNSIGSKGKDIRGQRLTTNIEFVNPQKSGKDITNYQAHIFHLVTASVRSDQTSGILIE